MSSDPVIRPQCWILQGKILTKVCKSMQKLKIIVELWKAVACDSATVSFVKRITMNSKLLQLALGHPDNKVQGYHSDLSILDV